jgi:hypothetical protein
MWFTREHFALCNELRQLGVEPRFEVGDVVARGFADLGFEEFQVLPGPSILSLTAGTVKPLPVDHRHHFFWIPSVDESFELLEARGVRIGECTREDGRTWKIKAQCQSGMPVEVSAPSLHEAVLMALVAAYSEEGHRHG